MGMYCCRLSGGMCVMSPSKILNPSWSCALLATSFWKIPSTPCMTPSAHVQCK